MAAGQRAGSGRASPVGDREVVLPGGPVPGQLALAGDRVAIVAEDAREPLAESGSVAPEPPLVFLEADRIQPVHAAVVEVVHGQLLVGDADDRDRVRDLRVVVVPAQNQELPAVQPLERGVLFLRRCCLPVRLRPRREVIGQVAAARWSAFRAVLPLQARQELAAWVARPVTGTA
jgi:hypothetical protein